MSHPCLPCSLVEFNHLFEQFQKVVNMMYGPLQINAAYKCLSLHYDGLTGLSVDDAANCEMMMTAAVTGARRLGYRLAE